MWDVEPDSGDDPDCSANTKDVLWYKQNRIRIPLKIDKNKYFLTNSIVIKIAMFVNVFQLRCFLPSKQLRDMIVGVY